MIRAALAATSLLLFTAVPITVAQGLSSDIAALRSTGNLASLTTDTSNMVLIPGGKITIGIDFAEIPRYEQLFGISGRELFDASTPKHSVILSPFFLDRALVTNSQFFEFTRRFANDEPSDTLARLDQPWTEIDPRSRYGDRKNLAHWVHDRVPKGLENHPATNVTWYDAVSYCQWQGKRLPTEAEWEHSARGGGNSIFPWGDAAADSSRANYSSSGFGTTTPVASYAPNAFGLYDMAGNVWQFTADEWAPYSSEPATNPVAGGNFFSKGFDFLGVTTRRVIRGGSWGGAPINLWVEYRDSHPPDAAKSFVGFRCAKSAK
jgi:formylglycine-generating enzyme required for sulfatase activity